MSDQLMKSGELWGKVVKDVQKNMFSALQSDDAKRMADLEAKQAQLGQACPYMRVQLGYST